MSDTRYRSVLGVGEQITRLVRKLLEQDRDGAYLSQSKASH